MSSLLEESHIVPDLSASNSDGDSAPLIRSFHRRRTIAGVPTELVVQTFDDRILVIVTQVGKVGCLYGAHFMNRGVEFTQRETLGGSAQAQIQASLPPSIPLAPPLSSSSAPSTNGHTTTSILASLPPPPPGISLTPLLGSPPDEAKYELYASQISTLVWWIMQTASPPIPRRPVVVGLALRRSVAQGDDEESEGRETFAGVMGLVSEWEG